MDIVTATDAQITSLWVMLITAPIAFLIWGAGMFLMFLIFGVKPRNTLREITFPEALFFVGWGFSSAYLVGAIFSRFV